jgi:hypothetical protein
MACTTNLNDSPTRALFDELADFGIPFDVLGLAQEAEHQAFTYGTKELHLFSAKLNVFWIRNDTWLIQIRLTNKRKKRFEHFK